MSEQNQEIGNRCPDCGYHWLTIPPFSCPKCYRPVYKSFGKWIKQMAKAVCVMAAFVAFSSLLSFRDAHFPEKTQLASVLIKSDEGSGSGVVIKRQDKLFVWTAGHVVAKDSSVKVIIFARDHNKQRALALVFNATVIGRLEKADSALLRLYAPPQFFSDVEFDPSIPLAGDRVLVVSSPHGREHDSMITDGVISQFGFDLTEEANDPKWTLIDMTSAAINPGSSGGAVYDLRTEKIIGLAVGTEGDGINFYLPVRAMQGQGFDWALFGNDCPTEAQLEFMEAQIRYE